MPGLIPAELYQWIENRQTDLQEALADGNTARVLELTSKMAEGAEHLREITGRLVIRAITHQCGLLGCRVGEGRNGVPRREIRRHDSSEATVMACDADGRHPATHSELEGPRAMDARRSRRRARSESESEGPVVHRNRLSVLSSDSDDTPLPRLGIHSPERGTTVAASSGAVDENLCEFRPTAATVMGEPVHRELKRHCRIRTPRARGPFSPVTRSGTVFKATSVCSCSGVSEFPKRSRRRSGLRHKWWTIWVAGSGQCLWKVASRDW